MKALERMIIESWVLLQELRLGQKAFRVKVLELVFAMASPKELPLSRGTRTRLLTVFAEPVSGYNELVWPEQRF